MEGAPALLLLPAALCPSLACDRLLVCPRHLLRRRPRRRIFIFISVTGVRTKFVQLVPKSIMLATAGGIGLFLAFIGLQKSEGLGVVVYDSATLVRLGGCPAYAQVNQYTIADPTQVCADPSDPAIGPPSSQYKCTQDVMTSPTMCVRGLRGEGGGPMAARSCTATMRSAPRPRPPRACG